MVENLPPPDEISVDRPKHSQQIKGLISICLALVAKTLFKISKN